MRLNFMPCLSRHAILQCKFCFEASKKRTQSCFSPARIFVYPIASTAWKLLRFCRQNFCVCVCVGLSSHGQYTFTIAFAWLLECSKNAKCTTKHRLTNHSYNCTFFKKRKTSSGKKDPRKYEMSDHNLILLFIMNPSPPGAKSPKSNLL